MIGDRVLLYNSRIILFPRKLKSRWSGPYVVKTVFLYGTKEVIHPEYDTFKVNGHRLKYYTGGDINIERDELQLQNLNQS
ncbi:retroelement polyprotein-like [Gossypium australe]|uniref:Retroelement polyprotein-like n=1 Tax=Gossypium australe TaxID=47621 RepID=A0A5B6WPT4_9ROSI|nr:retroelement polyprotein-like [Gossypium australe]